MLADLLPAEDGQGRPQRCGPLPRPGSPAGLPDAAHGRCAQVLWATVRGRGLRETPREARSQSGVFLLHPPAGPALPLRPPYERAPARLSAQGTFPSLITALTALASPAPRPGPRAGQSRSRSNPGAAPPHLLAVRGGRCREGARPTREGLGPPRPALPPGHCPAPQFLGLWAQRRRRGMGTQRARESCRPLRPGAPPGARQEPKSEP